MGQNREKISGLNPNSIQILKNAHNIASFMKKNMQKFDRGPSDSVVFRQILTFLEDSVGAVYGLRGL